MLQIVDGCLSGTIEQGPPEGQTAAGGREGLVQPRPRCQGSAEFRHGRFNIPGGGGHPAACAGGQCVELCRPGRRGCCGQVAGRVPCRLLVPTVEIGLDEQTQRGAEMLAMLGELLPVGFERSARRWRVAAGELQGGPGQY